MTAAELTDAARLVRNLFAKNARRGGFRDVGKDTVCDLEDVEQEAALAIWEAYARGKFDPAKGNARTFYAFIGQRAASDAMKRARSNVHLTDYAIDKLGRDGKDESRLTLIGCGAGNGTRDRVKKNDTIEMAA